MGWLLGCVVCLALVVALGVGCAQLPNEQTSVDLLHNLGYEQVQYTGRSAFAPLHGCSNDDVAVLHFNAVNARDISVKVDVCQGWPFGGAHMRGQ